MFLLEKLWIPIFRGKVGSNIRLKYLVLNSVHMSTEGKGCIYLETLLKGFLPIPMFSLFLSPEMNSFWNNHTVQGQLLFQFLAFLVSCTVLIVVL